MTTIFSKPTCPVIRARWMSAIPPRARCRMSSYLPSRPKLAARSGSATGPEELARPEVLARLGELVDLAEPVPCGASPGPEGAAALEELPELEEPTAPEGSEG